MSIVKMFDIHLTTETGTILKLKYPDFKKKFKNSLTFDWPQQPRGLFV